MEAGRGDRAAGPAHHLEREPMPAYTTVLSVMQKLEKAGWLTHRALGRSYMYIPSRSSWNRLARPRCAPFIERVFSGDRLLMFQQLLAEDDLSEEDLKSLETMIERKRNNKERRHG